jgi:hypothetical protein
MNADELFTERKRMNAMQREVARLERMAVQLHETAANLRKTLDREEAAYREAFGEKERAFREAATARSSPDNMFT